jgi:hypothetical protein
MLQVRCLSLFVFVVTVAEESNVECQSRESVESSDLALTDSFTLVQVSIFFHIQMSILLVYDSKDSDSVDN